MAYVFEGGAEIQDLTRGDGIDTRISVRCATTANITISTGLNSGDVIDGVTLADGDRVLVKNQVTQPEITDVTTVADVAGSLGGTYFLLNSPGTEYYVWFDVDNTSTDPGSVDSELVGSGRTGIEVDISASDGAAAVATALQLKITGEADFSASVVTSTVTITNAASGPAANAVDGADSPTGFSIMVTQSGSSSVDHGIYVVDAAPYRADDLTTGDSASYIFVYVREGTTNVKTGWICTTLEGSDIIDTDDIEWTQKNSFNYKKGDIVYALDENNLTTLSAPTTASLLEIDEAGNVTWTDRQNLTAGLDPKESVRVATDTTLTGATYAPGGGTGAMGEFTGVDLTSGTIFDLGAVTLGNGDRILIKDQTDPTQNGIYIVTDASTPASATIERSADQDGTPANEVSAGNFVFVENGTTYGDTGWIVQDAGGPTSPLIDLNTDDVDWVQFNGAGNIVAGDGLTKTGNTIDVNVTDVTTAIVSDDIVVRSNGTDGNILLSTAVAGVEAEWGTIKLDDTGSVVTNGAGDGRKILATNAAGAIAWRTEVHLDSILDGDTPNDNEVITFQGHAPTGAVNVIDISNDTTGNNPTIGVTDGTGDANIGLDFQAKGTGCYNFLATAAGPTCLKWYEDTDNGTNFISLDAPATIAPGAEVTWTLPPGPATAGEILTTDASGNWSFVDPNATNRISYALTTVKIKVNNSSYQNIAYFAWDNTTDYASYTSARLIFYSDNTAARDIQIKVDRVQPSALVMLAATTISADGLNNIAITSLPGADGYFVVSVKKSASGGSNPIIYGLQLEFND